MFDPTQPRAMNGRFAEKLGARPEVTLEKFAEPADVNDWPFDEYEMDTYTSGECYRLARALEQLGVGKLVAITTKDKPIGWRHMLVETDDGRYVDIEGIHTPEHIAERWFDDPADGLVVPVLNYDEAIRGQGQGAYTDEDAQEAAVRLVEACSR